LTLLAALVSRREREITDTQLSGVFNKATGTTIATAQRVWRYMRRPPAD